VAIPTNNSEVCLKLKVNLAVEITNLFFRMLEYAYKLEIRFHKGLNEAPLEEFYERLAHVAFCDRGRKGFYRAHVPERYSYIRGRLEMRQ